MTAPGSLVIHTPLVTGSSLRELYGTELAMALGHDAGHAGPEARWMLVIRPDGALELRWDSSMFVKVIVEGAGR